MYHIDSKGGPSPAFKRNDLLLKLTVIFFVLGLLSLWVFITLAWTFISVFFEGELREFVFRVFTAEAGTLAAFLVAFVSILSSIGTFIGFISTTVITWRKEVRDSRAHQLDKRLKEMQIMKMTDETRPSIQE